MRRLKLKHFVLLNLVLLHCIGFVKAKTKSVLCCGDDDDNYDDDLTNTTTHRTLRAAGTRQREKECPCDRPNPDTVWDKVLVPILVLFLLGLGPFGFIFRFFYHKRQRHVAASQQIELQRQNISRISQQVETVKSHLIVCPISNLDMTETCPICFDALCCSGTEEEDDKNNKVVVAPANCIHQFHKECLVAWIATAISEETPNNENLRALACPTCAQSMLPTLEEEITLIDHQNNSAEYSITNEQGDQDQINLTLIDQNDYTGDTTTVQEGDTDV